MSCSRLYVLHQDAASHVQKKRTTYLISEAAVLTGAGAVGVAREAVTATGRSGRLCLERGVGIFLKSE